jgi:hypothetical protein
MALAGRRFGCGRGVSGQRLSLSWHHTRSFCQRSRAESEQSRGSFAAQQLASYAGKGRLGALLRCDVSEFTSRMLVPQPVTAVRRACGNGQMVAGAGARAEEPESKRLWHVIRFTRIANRRRYHLASMPQRYRRLQCGNSSRLLSWS